MSGSISSCIELLRYGRRQIRRYRRNLEAECRRDLESIRLGMLLEKEVHLAKIVGIDAAGIVECGL
jgi:hypothetical protein